MNPTLATFSSPRTAVLPLKSLHSSSSPAPFLTFPSPKPLRLRACCSVRPDSIAQKLQLFAKTAVLVGATTLMIGKFSEFPARADPVPVTVVENEPALPVEKEADDLKPNQTSSLSTFLESDTEAVEEIKVLKCMKLENQEEEATVITLKRLVFAQPDVVDCKLLSGRLLGDMSQTEKACRLFDEILQSDPFAYKTLYKYALLIDCCGEGEVVLKMLEGVVALAERENKAKEARDVRFIISQLHFLQNSIPLIGVEQFHFFHKRGLKCRYG
ncbi:Detected protein of unknown function [Hibiscus syriacus]|uniref:Uncharacterized protein n=1 Tax=Hibiscus syriacus TaxID=106335 RepID=A0A6A3BV73_HIBSY|nr:protein SLOW GREEN 1, chloroplastic-like [Hibiscus syriacus]KAE8720554.1 Detected protein of unknown function [Hibiscus syriacus]